MLRGISDPTEPRLRPDRTEAIGPCPSNPRPDEHVGLILAHSVASSIESLDDLSDRLDVGDVSIHEVLQHAHTLLDVLLELCGCDAGCVTDALSSLDGMPVSSI